MHKKIEKLNEILEKDLSEAIEKVNNANTISPADVKTLTDAVCLMLKLKEYEEWEMSEDEGEYSGRSYSRDGNSYRRGRSSVTGRYMSRDYSPNEPVYMNGSYRNSSRRSRSYDDGYSGHSIKDRMIDQIESMYDEAKTEHERQVIDQWINRLEMEK